MNIVTILHNKAMEFADEALLAKMEGNQEASAKFWEQAFSLEKDATRIAMEEGKITVSQHILIRSAATLAFRYGNFLEAQELINLGREHQPPEFIVEELKELEQQIQAEQQELRKKGNYQELTGIIIDANATKNQITLQEIGNNLSHTIHVPGRMMKELIKSFWSETVNLKALRVPTGAILLESIDLAA